MARRLKTQGGPSLLAPDSDWMPPSELPSLAGARRICFDVETCDPNLSNGDGPGTRHGGFVVGVAIGIEGRGSYYLPVRHQGGGNLDENIVWQWARDELNSFEGDVVGANLKYDLDYAAENGVLFPLVRRFYDVQIAEPLLDEHRLKYSLDSLAHDYLEETKREDLLREAAKAYGFGFTDDAVKENLWRLPASYVGPYAEGDVDLPFRILDLQMGKLEKDGLLELFDLESRLMPVLLAMQRRGVRIDIDETVRIRERLVAERDAALARVRRIAGPKSELMAPDSFSQALVDRGLDVGRTPKSGQYSITAGWLEANEGDELVDAIQEGRRVNTIITTFIDGHILGHAVKGRIHCELVQLRDGKGGTGARFSSRNPNLQNVPARDSELGPLVRGAFVPDEGEDWEKQDESQMEYRLLVHFARGRGAAESRQKYRDDPKTDFHKMCAVMMNEDPEDKVVRKKVKGVNFASVYGAQVPRIASVLGVDNDAARAFLDRYNEALPFKQTTFDAVQNAAKEKGFIRDVLGRYARFVFWEPADNHRRPKNKRSKAYLHERAEAEYGLSIVRADTYKALNNLLQYSNASQIKKAMVDIWESGVCDVLGPFLLQVHDELNYSVPRTAAGNEAAAEAKRLTEVAVPLRVPVIVETARGLNWGVCG